MRARFVESGYCNKTGNTNIFVKLDESVNDNIAFNDNTKVQIKSKDGIFNRLKNEANEFYSPCLVYLEE